MPDRQIVGNTGDSSTKVLIKLYTESSSTTPDFWARKSRGEELPVNDYHWSSIRFTGSVVKRCNPWAQNAYFGWYAPSAMLNGSFPIGPGGPKAGTLTRYRQTLANKLFGKMLDANIDALAFAKELPQTVRMLTGMVDSVVGLYRALTFRQPQAFRDIVLWGRPMTRRNAEKRMMEDPTLKQHAQGLSNRWLECSFGVRPLLEDGENALKLLDNALVPEDRLITRDAYINMFDSYQSESLNTPSTWSFRGGSIRSQLSASCVYEVASPWDVLWQQLGLDNPAASAWECIPFSFVADWFFGIGDWLKSGRSIEGCSLKRSWRSEKLTANAINVLRTCSKTSTGREDLLEKHRYKLTGFPTFYSTPTWDPKLSVKRFTDALALGIQRLT